MTKNQAKVFAKIHSSTMISYIDGFAFMGIDGEQTIPQADQEKMIDACRDLANKIKGDLPQIPDSREIYKWIIKNIK